MSNKKIGLALSGGGLRGLAHIGIIKVMEEHRITADVVAGTSAGSIIGTLYAAGCSADEMLKFVKKSNLYKVISFAWPLMGFASHEYLKKRLVEFMPGIGFESMKIPLYITMTNMNSGKLEVKSEGDLLNYVAASCAIPMIFEPIEIEGQLYMDGGAMKNLPASIIRDECDILIGVNLMPRNQMQTEQLRSLISIAARTFEMSLWRNQQDDIPLCDLHIEVQGLQKNNMFNFNKLDDIYIAGYQTGQLVIPQLLGLLEQES